MKMKKKLTFRTTRPFRRTSFLVLTPSHKQPNLFLSIGHSLLSPGWPLWNCIGETDQKANMVKLFNKEPSQNAPYIEAATNSDGFG